MESSETMDRTAQSSTNRFSDGDDPPTEDCDLKKLSAECEKWSLKNDLQLLTHLKQMSSNLIDKSEAANQSMNNLVFNAKMHCVKVDNVINEFQMLANSQFVENRVYDEEVEDIMANEHNVHNEDTNAKPVEDISTKIKVALNIGLNFLNERFDCSSQSVPIGQNDSDDENDQILEGLISNSAGDPFSQRLLPYIIGSDDFAKDNYVGLEGPEENPIIDLNSRAQADRLSAQSVDSVESEADTFQPSSALPKTNHLIPNLNDINDSEDESEDLFGSVPQSTRANAKPLSSESESDSEPFATEEKPSLKHEESETNESKTRITSFHDELSAVIGGGRRPDTKPVSVVKDTKPESVVIKSEPILTPTLDSESSDESDSIFNVKKTKPKVENKQKNFSNLFGDEANDDSLFVSKKDKPKANVKVSNDLPKPTAQKIPVKTSSLFDDDDEDDDDLFSAAFAKKKPQSNDKNPVIDDSFIDKPVVNKAIVNKTIEKPKVTAQTKPIAKPTTSLFNDDDEDEDDLFSGFSSKPKPSPQHIPLKSESPEPEVKPTSSSLFTKPKPNNSLIGELSAALKKKQLFPSSDEESDESKSEDESSNRDLFTNLDKSAQNDNKPVTLNIKQDSKDSLFDNDFVADVKTVEVEPKQEIVETERLSDNLSKEDFLESEPTATLANDGLKHRAALGAQRQRRPPTKRGVRMTPATDFAEIQSTSQMKEEETKTTEEIEEKPKPVAAMRIVKPTNDITRTENDIPNKPKDNLFVSKPSKSIASLIKSPSTEEDDIFPTQIHTKNLNVNKISEKSENNSNSLFEDSGDDSLFSSKKPNKIENSKKAVDSKGLFDTSDSDDNDILSNKPSIISNIIKPSKSNEFFNDVSSTDSSLSNKSDAKTSVSRPAVSLFSDSDDDDLFAAVNKSKLVEKKKEEEKPVIRQTPEPIHKKTEVKTNNNLKKTNSLFSDDDEDTDLFAKSDNKKETKVTQSIQNTQSNRKPVFALDDTDSDEDLFASKPTKSKTTPTATQNKTETKRKDSDLFDDPLFASRS